MIRFRVHLQECLQHYAPDVLHRCWSQHNYCSHASLVQPAGYSWMLIVELIRAVRTLVAFQKGIFA